MFLNFIVLVLFFLVIYYIIDFFKKEHTITPPKLTNNPSYDVVVTSQTPLLSFFNSGGAKRLRYEIEIDTKKDFNSINKIRYNNIKSENEFITSKKINKKNALTDNTQYFWRVRAKSLLGVKSYWSVSRFYVKTKAENKSIIYQRTQVKNIEVSGGYNAKNIIDWDDPGLISYWQSPPPGEKVHWIKFDLGKKTTISRVWILSNPNDADGWLKNFYLTYSNDGKKWKKINDSEIKDNDTFRNIVDFKKISARYFKLVIKDFIGYAAQINEIILFTQKSVEVPKTPKDDYVLIIGNEHNGYTFTDLERHIEKLGYKTFLVPYYKMSFNVLNKLSKKPFAIVLSGNNADYPNLPMFEYDGEFEIIKNCQIPILGICAGHQFLAMAYDYTKARSMGWSDISAMEPKNKMTKIKIIKKDPIFDDMRDEFIAPEIHGWAVAEPYREFEVLTKSKYIQVQKSKKRFIYGIQFHSEIDVAYNQGKFLIKNFLRLAKKIK